jgi:tRNA G18 (ribose-2'-O)-methylase SpoU
MQRVDSIDDPRVAPYRNLRDRTLRGESIFVTEGRVLTQRLLESPFEAESVLAAEELAAEFAPLVADRTALYVAPESLLLEIVGFPFHRGVLGCGRRPPPKTFAELMSAVDRAAEGDSPIFVASCHKNRDSPLGLVRDSPLGLVICPEVTKPENLGLVFRTAAGFGVDGVLLGQRCCDPLSRRALRVSMGGVLAVPFARSQDLIEDLRTLKRVHGFKLLATVLDPRAERIERFHWPPRAGLLLGNESDGLREQYLSLCDHRLTIPMRPGTDSLNLGVAAGIFVYQMMRARGEPC